TSNLVAGHLALAGCDVHRVLAAGARRIALDLEPKSSSNHGYNLANKKMAADLSSCRPHVRSSFARTSSRRPPFGHDGDTLSMTGVGHAHPAELPSESRFGVLLEKLRKPHHPPPAIRIDAPCNDPSEPRQRTRRSRIA